jgi:adenosylhomocysteine nucleosidase
MSAGSARVLIVTAMPEELGALSARRLPEGVRAAATGEGPLRAERRAAELCDLHRPSILLGAGVAGALSPDLAFGEILVARRICDASGEAPQPDAALSQRAASIPGIRGGALFSADRMVVAARERSELAARIGDDPAAVDMESAGWARVASARGIPYVVVRAVSDTADEDLPAYLSRCYDPDGGIRRARVVLHALAMPGSVPRLLAMRRRVRECGVRLSAFVEHFLAGVL